ncbi:hypothetical protein VTN96DRAFT_3706 [Rasamsonia emersonii]
MLCAGGLSSSRSIRATLARLLGWTDRADHRALSLIQCPPGPSLLPSIIPEFGPVSRCLWPSCPFSNASFFVISFLLFFFAFALVRCLIEARPFWCGLPRLRSCHSFETPAYSYTTWVHLLVSFLILRHLNLPRWPLSSPSTSENRFNPHYIVLQRPGTANPSLIWHSLFRG